MAFTRWLLVGISGRFGRRVQGIAERFLRDGITHLVASDAHNTAQRAPLLAEARDAAGEPLGYQALESMLRQEPATGSPFSWLTALFDRVQRHTGRMPEDDWTAAMLVPRAGEEAS